MRRSILSALTPILAVSALAPLTFLSTARADNSFVWRKINPAPDNPNPNTGLWSQPVHWGDGTGQRYPDGAEDRVDINLKNMPAYTVTMDVDASVKQFDLDSPTATFAISDGKTLTVANPSKLTGGAMQLMGRWYGPLNNNATIEVPPGATGSITSAAFVQTGNLNILGGPQGATTLFVHNPIVNGGTITLDSTQDVGGKTSLAMFHGEDAPGGVIYVWDTLTNLKGKTVSFNKGSLQNEYVFNRMFSGNLDNKGTVNVDTSSYFWSPSLTTPSPKGTFKNTGTINIPAAAITLRAEGASFLNTKDPAVNMPKVGDGLGLITGRGTLDVTRVTGRKLSSEKGAKVNVKVNPPQAFLQTGFGPPVADQFNIIGDYEQAEAAILGIELDAGSSIIHHGQLNVEGDAFLDADSTIELSLLDGTNLTPGQQFPILVAQTRSGYCPTLTTPYIDGHYFSVDCDTAPNVIALRVDPTPEPATVLFLAIGGLVFAVRRR